MKSPFIDSPAAESAYHELNEMYDEIKFKSPFLDTTEDESYTLNEYQAGADDHHELDSYEADDREAVLVDGVPDGHGEFAGMQSFHSDSELLHEEESVYEMDETVEEAPVDEEEWQEDSLITARTDGVEDESETLEGGSDLPYTQSESPFDHESVVSQTDFNKWFQSVAGSITRFPDEPQHNIDQLPIPTWVSADVFYKEFIQKYGDEAKTIIGDTTQKVYARYFVLHDTAVAADFTQKRVKGKGIHLWVNAQSPVVSGNDWHVKGLGVKLERKKNHSFVHVEITRDRALEKAVKQKTKGKKVASETIKKAGGIKTFGTYYTDKQYELVAYAYLAASFRKGKFLTVTIHREVDRSVVLKRNNGTYGYGHDDPQFFDIDHLYAIICRILGIAVKATFGIQNERAMANKQSNMPGDVNAFIPFVTGEVEAANQYGALTPFNPRSARYKVVKLKHGYYYEVSQLKNRFQETEIDDELNVESSDLFSSESGTVATAPPLIAEDLSVPGYTGYVRINIGKGGYPLSTGIYIPAVFDPQQPVDVVLYLHGMTISFPGPYSQILDYWSVSDLPNFDLRIREEINASGKNVVLVAPPLGHNPNLYKNHLGSKKGGLDSFMNTVLSAVNLYIVAKRFKSNAISFRNVILAAHSAGGQHMVKIATAENPNYGPKISECWGFDCLYYPVAEIWYRWATKNQNKKLFIYYQSSTAGFSTQLEGLAKKLSNVFIKKSTARNHYWVVKEHLKDRLLKIGSSDLTKNNFEIYEEPDHEHIYDEFEEFDKDWSNAVRLNRQYGEQLGWKDFHMQINELLLPFSGEQNVTLGEEAFARALSAWQKQQGFSGKNSDGILGPMTWSRMEPMLKPGSINSGNAGSGTGRSGSVLSEWESNPGIRTYYASAQAYEKKRDDVVRWGVTDPAAYIESAINEWNANTSLHAHFDRNFDGEPKRSYLNLRRLYQKKSIANPAGYFAQNLVSVTFFNRKTPAHRDLATALNRAQSNLVAAGHNFTLANAWSFVPRTVNFDVNILSNHALGRAIDINYQDNPHITSAQEILVIDAVCRTVLTSGLLAESNPDVLRRASDHFRNTFNDAWVSQQNQPSLISAIRAKRTALDRYASSGFLNLSAILVRALQAAGLGWGGSWRNSKDFMHFEV